MYTTYSVQCPGTRREKLSPVSGWEKAFQRFSHGDDVGVDILQCEMVSLREVAET